MSGEGEIIGGLVQGGLTARAFEPTHGEGDGHTHEQACLNCGTPLVGKHCHGCGQAAHVHKTIGAFFHDLLHGVFHFEGKIWRTLPMLAWKPGQLTREYVDGRRASYISPIALFLFVVFLTFAIFNAIIGPIHVNPQTPAQARVALVEANAGLAALEKRKADSELRGEPIPGIDGQIVGATAARDALAKVAGSGSGLSTANIGESDRISAIEPLNQAWHRARSNPDLLIFKLQSNAYKYSWLLIPLSVPFLWLLFPFSRRFGLYDHTIFVTYSLSFMLLLAGLFSLAVLWDVPGAILAMLMLYAPLHMYRQLRGAYGVSRFGAWWRTWFLSLFAVLALCFFAITLTVLAAGA